MKFTTWTQCGVELNSLIMIRSYDKEANFYNEKLLTTMQQTRLTLDGCIKSIEHLLKIPEIELIKNFA